jgi:hypothetical protein
VPRRRFYRSSSTARDGQTVPPATAQITIGEEETPEPSQAEHSGVKRVIDGHSQIIDRWRDIAVIDL